MNPATREEMMIMALTFESLSDLNSRRVGLFGHGLNEWNELEWAGAMCGEAGEAANVAKKIRRIADGCHVNTNEQDADALRDALVKELADVVIYADLLAQRVGMSLADAVQAKFNEVSLRVGFTELLGCDLKGDQPCST